MVVTQQKPATVLCCFLTYVVYLTCYRRLHHKPEEDLGEAVASCEGNSSYREPGGHLCHLGTAVWTACRPQVCVLHRIYSDCRTLYSRNVHQSDSGRCFHADCGIVHQVTRSAELVCKNAGPKFTDFEMIVN